MKLSKSQILEGAYSPLVWVENDDTQGWLNVDATARTLQIGVEPIGELKPDEDVVILRMLLLGAAALQPISYKTIQDEYQANLHRRIITRRVKVLSEQFSENFAITTLEPKGEKSSLSYWLLGIAEAGASTKESYSPDPQKPLSVFRIEAVSLLQLDQELGDSAVARSEKSAKRSHHRYLRDMHADSATSPI